MGELHLSTLSELSSNPVSRDPFNRDMPFVFRCVQPQSKFMRFSPSMLDIAGFVRVSVTHASVFCDLYTAPYYSCNIALFLSETN